MQESINRLYSTPAQSVHYPSISQSMGTANKTTSFVKYSGRSCRAALSIEGGRWACCEDDYFFFGAASVSAFFASAILPSVSILSTACSSLLLEKYNLPASCFCLIICACCSLVRWNSVPDCCSPPQRQYFSSSTMCDSSVRGQQRKGTSMHWVDRGRKPYGVLLLLTCSFLLRLFAGFVTLVAAGHLSLLFQGLWLWRSIWGVEGGVRRFGCWI
jgi:hypothetical protein